MHKKLSIFTALFTYLIALPFAVLGGYSIGYIFGAQLHHKGDMGTGTTAIALIMFALPLAIGASAASIWLINKIVTDIYDKNKIASIKIYCIGGLASVALITALYVTFNSSLWNY